MEIYHSNCFVEGETLLVYNPEVPFMGAYNADRLGIWALQYTSHKSLNRSACTFRARNTRWRISALVSLGRSKVVSSS